MLITTKASFQLLNIEVLKKDSVYSLWHSMIDNRQSFSN